MLLLLKPWTFDPGQLSGFRPTADVLVLVTVAFFMGLIVSVRLVRFLWVLQRHTAVARGMVWMCAGLIVLNICRAFRSAPSGETLSSNQSSPLCLESLDLSSCSGFRSISFRVSISFPGRIRIAVGEESQRQWPLCSLFSSLARCSWDAIRWICS